MKKNLLIILICYMNVYSADWPMWRNNAYRTGAGSDQLPDNLELQWQRSYSPRETVWDDPLNQDLMPYDRVFEPVVKDGNLYLGFNDTDKLVCIDCKTGKEKWAFYTDGPVRLPAACYKNNVYVTSDDGYLYCLNSSDGSLLWKLRGGPSDRKIIGNKRFISTWPVRGGVVIYDDTLYFTASIWPFMGTFIYALDPNTGAIVWLNDGSGADWVKQPHNHMSFAGVAPQGLLTATKDFLLIPGGRSVPACYDRKTGEFIYYNPAQNHKSGGSFIFFDGNIFFNHDREKCYNMYDLKTGKSIKMKMGIQPVISDSFYIFSGKNITAYSKSKPDSLYWSLDVDASGDLIQSGNRLYAAGKKQLTAIDIKNQDIIWQYPIKNIERLVAANNQLFAVSVDGDIYAFGSSLKNGHNNILATPKTVPDTNNKTAKTIISTLEINEGYALVFNPPNTGFLETLVAASDLHIIAYIQNTNDLEKWRKNLDLVRLYGKRVHLLPGSPQTVELAPYFASLVLFPDAKQTENILKSNFLEKIYQSVRPYGGKIWMNTRNKTISANHNLPQAKASFLADGLVISRDGKLKGAANWTHQYGDIENTLKSDDDLVQLPLGILWFGGSSNLDVLPRHGHGPPEQVVDGRLFIEGMNCMNARDVYTGRVLWKKEFTSLGTFGMFFNETFSDIPLNQAYNQEHIPGANARGTNFIVTSDLVYIVQGMVCLTLDVETGEEQNLLQLPPLPTGSRAEWGYIGVQGNNLIAGAGFIPFSDYLPGQSELTQANGLSPSKARKVRDFSNYDKTSSKMLVVMDRHTGQVKWTMVSHVGFIHNAITVHDNTLYCMDKLPPYYAKKLERRGMDFHDKNRLMALDIETGEIKWQLQEPVFGSWLSYSKDYNLLLQATRPSNDMLYGEEGTRMIVHNAGDGSVVWDKNIEYDNPPLLHTDKILSETRAFSLLTGEPLQRKHPLTGQNMDWAFITGHKL